METLGLTLADLYDRPMAGGPRGVVQLVVPAQDLLVILDHEVTVAVLILHDIVTRRQVNERQVQRLALAAARIGKARDMVNSAKVSSRAA